MRFEAPAGEWVICFVYDDDVVFFERIQSTGHRWNEFSFQTNVTGIRVALNADPAGDAGKPIPAGNAWNVGEAGAKAVSIQDTLRFCGDDRLSQPLVFFQFPSGAEFHHAPLGDLAAC